MDDERFVYTRKLLEAATWTDDEGKAAVAAGEAEEIWVELDRARILVGWWRNYDWVCSDCGGAGFGHHACEAGLAFGDESPND